MVIEERSCVEFIDIEYMRTTFISTGDTRPYPFLFLQCKLTISKYITYITVRKEIKTLKQI